jgi:hypothetical protein
VADPQLEKVQELGQLLLKEVEALMQVEWDQAQQP